MFLIVRFSFENVRKNAAWFYGNSENRPIIHLSKGRIIKFLPFYFKKKGNLFVI